MVVFVKSSHAATSVLAGIAAFTSPNTLNVNETTSIQGVARTIAAGAMSYYPGTAQAFADLPQPYYWWQCGALIGAMLDYSHYTGDPTYDRVIATALLAQTGPDKDFMVPAHFGDEGNDDQAFWGFAVMSAAERNFPQPNAALPSWLELGQNIWTSLAARWNDNDACGGGLAWQIFPSNPNGITYKNSVANGGLLQLSARLARATGDAKYLAMANKIWDWSTKVGIVDQDHNVFDGVDIKDSCSKVNTLSFSYTAGVYLYGAAVMANTTGDATWASRAQGLLEAGKWFFSPFDNSTGIMFEPACETVGTCNADMMSFKGYYARFARMSAHMQPNLAGAVDAQLALSARAAANACSGGAKGTECGQKWYVGGFDGKVGLGQQMCALENVHGLLAPAAPVPLKGADIKVVRDFRPGTPDATGTTTPVASDTAAASPSKRSNAARAVDVSVGWFGLSGLTGLLVWGML